MLFIDLLRPVIVCVVERVFCFPTGSTVEHFNSTRCNRAYKSSSGGVVVGGGGIVYIDFLSLFGGTWGNDKQDSNPPQ